MEIKTFDDLHRRDIELNEQYRKELLEDKNAEQFELKMRFKAEWYRMQVYKILYGNKDLWNETKSDMMI